MILFDTIIKIKINIKKMQFILVSCSSTEMIFNNEHIKVILLYKYIS